MKKIFARINLDILYLFLFAVVVAANIIVSPVSYKLDFSKGKAHTLSDSTKSILRNLKKTATVTFFVSEELPSRLIPLKRDVDDVLNEYRRESGGKLVLKYTDPKNDQKAQTLAQEYGISPLRFSQQESDNYAVSTSYFGLGIEYDGKKASIPQATGADDLEYNITSSIYKLGVKQLPQVGLLGTEGAENQITTFAQVAASQFQLMPAATLSAQLKTLVIFDSVQGFQEGTIKNVDQYLNNGGKAIIFTKGIDINEDSSFTAQKAKSPVYDLLRKRGITINQDMVLSTSAEFVNFAPQGSGAQLLIPYPFWLKTNVFDTDSPFFSNINQLSFPWTSSLSVKSPAETIVRTTTQSWHLDKDFNLDPQNIAQPSPKDITQFNLIARSKGPKGSEVVVIPSARFLYDRYLSGQSGNLELVMNILSEFASGGALAGIRSRAVNYYLIPAMDTSQKNFFKYANVVVLPGLFTLIMAMRVYRRNRRSRDTG